MLLYNRDFAYHNFLVILLIVTGPAREEDRDKGDYNTRQRTVEVLALTA